MKFNVIAAAPLQLLKMLGEWLGLWYAYSAVQCM